MTDLRIAVVGVGLMGADHVTRIDTTTKGARVAVVSDYIAEEADEIAAGIDGCRAVADPSMRSPIPTSTPSCWPLQDPRTTSSCWPASNTANPCSARSH